MNRLYKTTLLAGLLVGASVLLHQSATCNTSQAATPSTHGVNAPVPIPQTEAQKERSRDIKSLLEDAITTQSSAWYILLLAFLAGILVSFTPCLYPMIPITAGILQAQAGKSMTHNFLSALSYVTGIATIYATLGYVSAKFAIMFGKWLASPFFMVAIALFFLYFAFSMLGFYDMYMPSFLSGGTQLAGKRGSLLYSFLFGLVSGTVASPCLTPALALLLGMAAKEGNPLMGFLTLFSFSMGMGVLLILIGTFSSTITLLPRSGEWMNYIKQAFGFLMLAMCVYFLQPLLPLMVRLGCYGLVSASGTIFYFSQAKKSSVALVLGILGLLATIMLGSWFLRGIV